MIGRSDSCPLIIFFYTPFYVLRPMRLGVITLIRNSPGGRRAGPFGSMSRLAFCFRELNIWKARQTSKSFGLIEARQCPQQLWTSWKQMEGPNPVSMCSVYSEGGSEPIRLYVFRILRGRAERSFGYPVIPSSFRPLPLLAAFGLSSLAPATLSRIHIHIEPFLFLLYFPLLRINFISFVPISFDSCHLPLYLEL